MGGGYTGQVSSGDDRNSEHSYGSSSSDDSQHTPNSSFAPSAPATNFGSHHAHLDPSSHSYHDHVPKTQFYPATTPYIPVAGGPRAASCVERFCLCSVISLIFLIAIVSICLIAVVA